MFKKKRWYLIVPVVFCLFSTAIIITCNAQIRRPSLALVSAHLEHDPGTFQQAAKAWRSHLNVKLFASHDGDGILPTFSVAELSHYDLVIFESVGARISLLQPQIDSLKKRTKVLFLFTPMAIGNVAVRFLPDLEQYWSEGNLENYKGLLSYIAGNYFHLPVSVQKPIMYPACGFYHPFSDRIFPDAQSYLEWYTRHFHLSSASSRPVIGITFYQSYYVKKDLVFIDSLVSCIAANGAIPMPYMSPSVFRLDSIFRIRGRRIIDALIYGNMFLNFRNPEQGLEDAKRLDLPLLQYYADYYHTRKEWQAIDKADPAMADRFYFTELDGAIEPLCIAAEDFDSIGIRHTLPIDYQVQWRVGRALNWIKLAKTNNAKKKILLTYYSEGNSQADVGADLDAYLDVPASLVKLLEALKNKGYDVGQKTLPDKEALIMQMSKHAFNVPSSDTVALRKKLSSGDCIILPEKDYKIWFGQLPKQMQETVIRQWGQVPGKLMTLQGKNGNRYFVFPVIKLGNVMLAPHPNWGVEGNPQAIFNTESLPPSHAYLAFFFWMQHRLNPSAFVSFFTQLSLMPGKEQGPSRKDWTGILLGNVPHISLAPLVAGGALGNKRKTNAVVIDYITETSRSVLGKPLERLRNLLVNWDIATNPEIRNLLADSIYSAVKEQGLFRDLGWSNMPSEPWTKTRFMHVRSYLDRLSRMSMPLGSHILGNCPDSISMISMLEEMLYEKHASLFSGDPLERRGKMQMIIRQWLEDSIIQTNDSAWKAFYSDLSLFHKGLASSGNELNQLVHALDGGYILPGPGEDPLREAASLPSGRNPYVSNSKMIPSQVAWQIGARLARQLLERFQHLHGVNVFPRKCGFVLWSSEVTQTQGVTEAEILNLIGVKPVWNSKGQIMGMTCIPRKELGHPRIDVVVTTSGTYRDHFRGNIEFLDKAIRLAAQSNEADNNLHINAVRYMQKLHLDSFDGTLARIFSSNVGAYSTNMEFATRQSGQNDSTLKKFYLERMCYAYGEQMDGAKNLALFTANMEDLDIAAFSRSSSVYGIMDHPMVAAYFGAYNLAVAQKGKVGPDLFINDLHPGDTAAVIPLETFFRSELRTRYFSDKWIKGMMAHGYDGARYFNGFVQNMFIWNVTNKDMVKSSDWDMVYHIYVEDQHQLGLRPFLSEKNPAAAKEIAAQLLKAHENGFWHPSDQQLSVIKKIAMNEIAEKSGNSDAHYDANHALNSIHVRNKGNVSGWGNLSSGTGKKSQEHSLKTNGYQSISGQELKEDKIRLSTVTAHLTKGVVQTYWWLILVCSGLFVLGFLQRRNKL